ncbi:MAG: aliphatic sulfonate ABC transporter substrate-binding protein [Alphaproteobacteria bacterium]
MLHTVTKRLAATAAIVLGTFAFSAAVVSPARAENPKTVTLDWAYYNPVSLVLKDKGWLEKDLAKDGIKVRWVHTLGSNKAIEFLNARSIDFGSTAGAAALLAKINGSPIQSIYVYSKPEWTALVTGKNSSIKTVADLKGKRVAVTRGTDPYIFLVRVLGQNGLSEKDIKPVLLQHADGRAALERGDVDAWAGLDPMMAQAELEIGARLFFRNADLNTWGVLNVTEEFAKHHPQIVERVLASYEQARKHALANPAELKAALAKAAKLSDAVAAKQLERTELTHSSIGKLQVDSLIAAGKALQTGGVIPADVKIEEVVASLIQTKFSAKLQQAAK